MSAAPDVLGLKAFALHAGFKPGYITQLKAAGRLVLTTDGKRVRVAESLALIRDTADPAKAGVVARHAATRGKGRGRDTAAKPSPAPAASAPPAPAPADDAEPVDFSDPVESSHARRRARALADKAETDAKAAERDYRLSLGELLEAGEVVQVLQAAATTFRTTLENLPSSLAPELAATTDEGRIRVLLQDAHEHALEELSRQFGALAKADAP